MSVKPLFQDIQSAMPEMTVHEQEELICMMLSQHLLRHSRRPYADIKPFWLAF